MERVHIFLKAIINSIVEKNLSLAVHALASTIVHKTHLIDCIIQLNSRPSGGNSRVKMIDFNYSHIDSLVKIPSYRYLMGNNHFNDSGFPKIDYTSSLFTKQHASRHIIRYYKINQRALWKNRLIGKD